MGAASVHKACATLGLPHKRFLPRISLSSLGLASKSNAAEPGFNNKFLHKREPMASEAVAIRRKGPNALGRLWFSYTNSRKNRDGIRWSSPTQLLIRPSLAYLWESGRDPEFSSGYGRDS
ncbi:hypothetical protein LZ32DRAFT_623237 [Colletotrichum eremochloae]|nr:hypothetical protein LZ32DRAFT_623237 [Colletotrichum eremochloae]